MDRFRALFEACGDAVLLFDPVDDRVTEANPSACRLLRYPRGELLGMRVSRLHPGQLAGLVVFTDEVLTRGTGWSDGLRCRRGDGKLIPVEIAAAPLVEEGKALIVASLRDPAVRRRREAIAEASAGLTRPGEEWRRSEYLFAELERQNRLILRAAGEGIYGVNADGKTTFVNPAAARILGWSADELVGTDMHTMIHHTRPDGHPYPACECPIYEAFRDGVVHQVEDELFWRRDGAPIRVEYTSTPILDGGTLVGAVIVFRDITRRKEAEERLHAALEEVTELRRRLELENAYLQEELRGEYSHREIIGRSAAIRHIGRQIDLVAPTDATVLVTGESGTGKELIARAIHEASARRDRPLIRVNCAAIPRELFESEFFGHTKGAFTGAVRDRVGRFELADGGTLFLDEVGEIPPELQGKLLRVLQEGQFERVGEERTRRVDVRLIAATNRDLKREARAGRFREDLYFRLNVFPIEAVPLRERREDIPLLAAHILERVCRKLRISGLNLTQGNVRRLTAYDWPGNVRELENVIERAAILGRDGKLCCQLPDPEEPFAPAALPHALPRTLLPPTPQLLTEEARRDRDRSNIVAALEACGGKVFGKGGAAELLGVKPTTLTSRIKALGIGRGRG